MSKAIKLVGVSENTLSTAVNLPVHFVRQYSDNLGIYNGVTFTSNGRKEKIIYISIRQKVRSLFAANFTDLKGQHHDS